MKTYFYPLSESNNREVDNLFVHVAGGTNFQCGEVEVVQGRHIHVNRFLK